MGYCVASDVAVLVQNILSGASEFSASSSPTSTAVTQWISSGCGIIETTLQGAGYETPITAPQRLFDWLRDLNGQYAAAMVEMSRTNATLGPGERTRGQVFEKMFWNGLDRLLKSDLIRAGATTSSTSGTLYIGGISQSDKDTYNSDTDRVPSRFQRGFARLPGLDSILDNDTDD